MEHEAYRVGALVLDGWRVAGCLGAGSYGAVYEIEREEAGHTFRAAMKVIRVPQSDAELQNELDNGSTRAQAKAYFAERVRKIADEFIIMDKLKGTSNIVSCEELKIIEHKNDIGWDILIRMELLHPILTYAKSHPLARRDVIKLGTDLCRALTLCQKFSIIHRDIKLENIFVSDNGDYKLGDFGVARSMEDRAGGLSKKGTYSYMAPEILRGEDYSFSADLYSLGIVLYRLLNRNCGPFVPLDPAKRTASAREAADARRMAGDPFPKPVYSAGRLDEIICKACAFRPEDRYSSPGDMQRDLEAIQYDAEDAKIIYPDGDELSVPSPHYVTDTPSGGTSGGMSGGKNDGTVQVFPGPKPKEEPPDGTVVVFPPEPPKPPKDLNGKKKKKSGAGKVLGILGGCVAGAAALVVVLMLVTGGKKQPVSLPATDVTVQTDTQDEPDAPSGDYTDLMSRADSMCQTDPEGAMALYEQARQLEPEQAAPCIGYAYALYCAREYDACTSYIEDELGLGKQYSIEAQSQLSEILGAAYFEQDDYAAAASFFRLSTAGGDITVNAQRDYAVSLGRLGDLDAAEKILREMIAAGADSDVTDYVSAEVAYAKKEYLDAESRFTAVLQSTKDASLQRRAMRSLAELYRDCAALVRTDSSPIHAPATKEVELLADGIERYGLRYDATIWEMLALAYFEAYHTDVSAPESYLKKSAECFERVIELGITKDYLYRNLYTIYYEMQDYSAAGQALDDYAAQYPNAYEPHALRAILYITIENRKDAAARDYSAAVQEYETAGAMLRSGDDETSYQQLRTLIEQLRAEGWIG